MPYYRCCQNLNFGNRDAQPVCGWDLVHVASTLIVFCLVSSVFAHGLFSLEGRSFDICYLQFLTSFKQIVMQLQLQVPFLLEIASCIDFVLSTYLVVFLTTRR